MPRRGKRHAALTREGSAVRCKAEPPPDPSRPFEHLRRRGFTTSYPRTRCEQGTHGRTHGAFDAPAFLPFTRSQPLSRVGLLARWGGIRLLPAQKSIEEDGGMSTTSFVRVLKGKGCFPADSTLRYNYKTPGTSGTASFLHRTHIYGQNRRHYVHIRTQNTPKTHKHTQAHTRQKKRRSEGY